MTTRAESAGGQHATANSIFLFLKYFQSDQSVVDQHGVTDVDVVNQSFVIHVDGVFLLAVRATYCEFENVSGLQMQVRLQIARANRRTLGIEQNSDGAPRFLGELANQ